MKNFSEFGKPLSRMEQKVINGGDLDAPKCRTLSCDDFCYGAIWCIGEKPACLC